MFGTPMEYFFYAGTVVTWAALIIAILRRRFFVSTVAGMNLYGITTLFYRPIEAPFIQELSMFAAIIAGLCSLLAAMAAIQDARE